MNPCASSPPSSGSTAMSIFLVTCWRSARGMIKWLCTQERCNPEDNIILGKAARYHFAAACSSHDDAHSDQLGSELRSTSRFGFAVVSNALNLELNILRHVVLHCHRRNAPSLLRLACFPRGCVVLYRSRGRPLNPPSPLRSAAPLPLALLCTKECCAVCTGRGKGER
jgi:hypothetical protein